MQDGGVMVRKALEHLRISRYIRLAMKHPTWSPIPTGLQRVRQAYCNLTKHPFALSYEREDEHDQHQLVVQTCLRCGLIIEHCLMCQHDARSADADVEDDEE